MEQKKESHIELYYDCAPDDREDWPTQHRWLKENVEKLYSVFGPIMKKIDLSEYTPSEVPGGDQ